jgi:tight adherence protein B
MIWIVLGLTFLISTTVVLCICFLIFGESAQDVIRGRIEKLRMTEKWTGIATDLNLIRDEMFSTIPLLHTLLSQAPGSAWAQKYLAQGGVKTKPAKLLLLSIVIAMVVYAIVSHYLPYYLALVASIMTFFIPVAVVAWKRQNRLDLFEERFPDALDMLSRAVRAGHAFTSAMELVVQESPEPVAGEFSIAYEEQNYGIPLRDALLHLADRVPIFDVRFMVTALIVQKDSGGNLAEILDQMSRVIRERFRIRRDVKSKTAMGRLTAGILILLPFAMLAMMMSINRDYESVLFSDADGPIILAIAVFMQVIGALILWRVVQIEV